ncbi:MAG: hypothetical protein WC030_03455 [Candidatus Paceibacterota bacterium]
MNTIIKALVVTVLLVAAVLTLHLYGAPPKTPTDQEVSQVYSSEMFSIRTPKGYTVDESYTYQALGPGKEIKGVKFTVPVSLAEGTNLSSDSYVSVEQMPAVDYCAADLFLDLPGRGVATDGKQLVASSTGAAAGNRYEEVVYAIAGTKPCVAVRYFIHYGMIENYPEGSVHAFDRTALQQEFDAIRSTLVVAE